MPVWAVLNQKGGVGKTTIALNLAHTWAAAGHRVLVVDVDKQAAATATLHAADLELDTTTIADVLRAPDRESSTALADALLPTEPAWGTVELVPASLDLEDVWSSAKPGIVFRLRRALDEADAHTRWDHVLLDGPPDLGPGAVAACVAADLVIVPTRPERMSMHGVARTVETVAVVRRDMRPDVRLAGIVPVAVQAQLNEHTYRVEDLRRIYGEQVTRTVIPHRLKADEASGAGLPAAALAGPAGAAMTQVYTDLAHELAEKGPK